MLIDNLIDTHTHLYDDSFDSDLDDCLDRAEACGVSQFYLPATDSSTTAKMFALEQKYPEKIKLMIGLHPTYVRPETVEKELAHIAYWLEKKTFVALGEIGIDLYWDKTYLTEQIHAFETQIIWAKKYNLPIVIHCRDSFDEIFQVLERQENGKLTGILHCFSGDLTQAQKAIAYGMKLGIGGVVTFKNGKIDQFLNQIDLKHLVLETDSPYLAPIPFRGKRNESAYTKIIAQKLADIYATDLGTIAKITTKNALEVFSPTKIK